MAQNTHDTVNFAYNSSDFFLLASLADYLQLPLLNLWRRTARVCHHCLSCTKLSQTVLLKILIVATRSHILKL